MHEINPDTWKWVIGYIGKSKDAHVFLHYHHDNDDKVHKKSAFLRNAAVSIFKKEKIDM